MTARIFLAFLAIFLVGVGLLAWYLNPQDVEESSVPRVATTIYPLAEFARQVGGDFVEVINLTPTGVEPHDFEPTPQTLEQIYQSDLFLYNGGGIDAWATKLAESLPASKTLRITDRLNNLLPATEEGDAFDEHVWLSPKRVQDQVVIIRDALIEIAPEDRDAFEKNAAAFLQELQTLDEAFQNGLAQCAIRTAVTSHAAFGYLASDYGFTQIAITGLSPEQEPSAGDLARIEQEARAAGVTYIFFETLVSPELARTLANELGAQTLVFNPLEGLTREEMAEGKTYLRVMRENLINLQTALACR